MNPNPSIEPAAMRELVFAVHFKGGPPSKSGDFGVMKLVYCITKKPGLSDDDFSDYWRNIHGPIGAKIPLLNRPKTRITIGQGGIQPGPAISE